MDFKPRKPGRLHHFGLGVGYSVGMCVFTTAVYYVTGKAGIHHIDTGTYAVLAAALLAAGTAVSAAYALGKKTSDSAADFKVGLKAGFIGFGHGISHAVNNVVLSTVYFTGVGMVSAASKALGRRYMDRGFRDGRKSYYVAVELGGGRQDDYLRQF